MGTKIEQSQIELSVDSKYDEMKARVFSSRNSKAAAHSMIYANFVIIG
jgi:hypothetical protein